MRQALAKLGKKAQIAIFVASTLITILSYLNAYSSLDQVVWLPFITASMINVLKSLIDFLMGRTPGGIDGAS